VRLLPVVLWVAVACTPVSPTSSAPSPAPAEGGAAEIDASRSAPQASAAATPSDPGPWPDAPGDTPSDVTADTEMACDRSTDGKTGQWSQIKFHTKTWRELVSRVDHGKGGGAELASRMRAQCEASHDSACCKRRQ
jgi:hypothetical protein